MLIYTLLQRLLVLIFHIKLFINKVCSLATHFMGRWRHYVFDLFPSICAYIQRRFRIHWRQPRRGCRGHIPNFLVGGKSTGISPQYYYVLSDIADQYWLPSVRAASSRFHSAIRRHQFASVRQADSRLTRLVPTNLELALTPLFGSSTSGYVFIHGLLRQSATSNSCSLREKCRCSKT